MLLSLLMLYVIHGTGSKRKEYASMQQDHFRRLSIMFKDTVSCEKGFPEVRVVFCSI